MTALPTHVRTWIRGQAIAWRLDNTHKFPTADPDGTLPTPEDQLGRAIIDALCNGACPWAAAIVEYVDRRRAIKEAA